MLGEKLWHYLDLRNEVEDFDTIHTEIEKGVIFKGTNLWILVFAIVIASVGLNTNSTAVIIGAMLVSPLMGPINGMGYSLATYNFPLFQKAIKNFTFAVIASLIASTIYFYISPVSAAQSELLARTSPTIYDVLIALFGGLAGMVAISSKLKGNVLPGVAIATALMPPLCTAGYGLANAKLDFFLGAIYLFTINTVFIAFAGVLVSQFLNFPIHAELEPAQKTRINHYISAIIVLTALPSIYFGYRLVLNERFQEKASHFIKSVTVLEGSYLLNHEIQASSKTINLVYGGSPLSEEAQKTIRNKAKDFNLDGVVLNFQQGFTFVEKSKSEVQMLKAKINAMSLQIITQKNKIDSLQNLPLIGKQLLKEIKALYPKIEFCAYAHTIVFNDSAALNPTPIPMVVFTYARYGISPEDKNAIERWVQRRLSSEEARVYFKEL
jgi:uncharacterized hydrophobic protein (TIGR00271 family)